MDNNNGRIVNSSIRLKFYTIQDEFYYQIVETNIGQLLQGMSGIIRYQI
jgi:hypothetical protein